MYWIKKSYVTRYVPTDSIEWFGLRFLWSATDKYNWQKLEYNVILYEEKLPMNNIGNGTMELKLEGDELNSQIFLIAVEIVLIPENYIAV